MIRQIVSALVICGVCFAADQAAQPSLTVYNQNFAVVRQELPLELKAGVNNVRVTDITMHLEPDSVILRDPTGKHPVQVLEQNYRADPISESLLLSLYEGKTIDFLMQRENKQEIVPGKIIRSGYTPHNYMAMRRYGSQYYQAQMAYAQGGNEQPIVEIEGKFAIRFAGNSDVSISRRRQRVEADSAMVALFRSGRTAPCRIFLCNRGSDLGSGLQHSRAR